jgi:cysteinyl-tRNA synthetase
METLENIINNEQPSLDNMSLRIYNTLTKKKEKFIPCERGKVGMYVCGVTVYGPLHMGHARTYIAYDIIREYLEKFKNLRVKYVQNITDVGHLVGDADEGEDKIIKAAKKEKKSPIEIANYYIKEMWKYLDALKIRKPDFSPRATEHIQDMIKIIQGLIKKGYAYEVNGSVYYDVSKFKDYGKLSGNTIQNLSAGARIAINQEKKHPFDFALWKKAEPSHLMQWDSPWGKGYPGWHIECSVMSMKYLGETFDIHGGAIELAFPHHENEIAQSEAYTGKKMVKYWVHTGLLYINGQKMAKSRGNFITVKEAIEKYGSDAIRFFIASQHYRSPIDLTEKSLEQAKSSFKRINNFVRELQNSSFVRKNNGLENVIEKHIQRFEDAMDDDFNTPKALSEVFSLINISYKAINANRFSENSKKKILDFLYKFNSVFKFISFEEKKDLPIKKEEIERLIKERDEARKNKDYEKADRIRDYLKEKGIILSDTKEGTKWEIED